MNPWCRNTLRIGGRNPLSVLRAISPLPDEELAALINHRWHDMLFSGELISFETLLPRPKGVADNDLDWYQENWGTIWDAVDVFISKQQEDLLELHFRTRDTPPIPFLAELRRRFPDHSFELEAKEPYKPVARY
jgi:hypothetical protein